MSAMTPDLEQGHDSFGVRGGRDFGLKSPMLLVQTITVPVSLWALLRGQIGFM